jgi:hypothetical protein
VKYDYQCENQDCLRANIEEERNVPMSKRNDQPCNACGLPMKRIFTPCLNILIPPWFGSQNKRPNAGGMYTNEVSKKNWDKERDVHLARDL